MDKEERLIREYLENNLDMKKIGKTDSCPDEQRLLEYLSGSLEGSSRKTIEHHIAGCGFCLSQLSIAFDAQKPNIQKKLNPTPKNFINDTCSLLGIKKDKITDKKNITKSTLFLTGTVICFILSFVVAKYFLQFLAATIVLGIRWALESKNGQTLIMILDSWRKHSKEKDNEISNRLKDHF